MLSRLIGTDPDCKGGYGGGCYKWWAAMPPVGRGSGRAVPILVRSVEAQRNHCLKGLEKGSELQSTQVHNCQ